jgi:hypothetical protein
MNDDIQMLESLKQEVLKQIGDYRYSVPESALGQPWTEDQVRDGLQEMRNSLVEPYWADVVIADKPEQWNLVNPIIRRCIAVADNREGYLLLWDPEEHRYMLGHNTNGPLSSFGIWGDAVGCFLAI